MSKPELTPDQFQRIARTVSDPSRWKMLRLIFQGPEDLTCGCISSAMPISAGTSSHHLKELELAGLIAVTKCGRYKKLAPCRGIWQAYLKQLREL